MNSKREQIIEAADTLFYQKGYEHTSFADIAAEIDISRGNFYHHFKTKDDILNAVIENRRMNSRRMLTEWESEAADPKARILKYIHIVITNQTDIELYGCPLGTLSTELSKLRHISKSEANDLFRLFADWLAVQFAALGLQMADAKNHAMHVLAWSQGVATMANAFQDRSFVEAEVSRISAWLDQIETM